VWLLRLRVSGSTPVIIVWMCVAVGGAATARTFGSLPDVRRWPGKIRGAINVRCSAKPDGRSDAAPGAAGVAVPFVGRSGGRVSGWRSGVGVTFVSRGAVRWWVVGLVVWLWPVMPYRASRRRRLYLLSLVWWWGEVLLVI
jgi:hypothetical protein